jgi:hypothetical protein
MFVSHSETLLYFVLLFQKEGNIQPSILALEMIFTEVLKRREMSRDFTAAANEHGNIIWL